MEEESFQEKLQRLADEFAHEIYHITKSFPSDEKFGLTSQLRRATLSVPLNIVEGYARKTDKSQRYFFSISFGSVKESTYLLNFSVKEHYCTSHDIQTAMLLSHKVAGMLWGVMRRIDSKK